MRRTIASIVALICILVGGVWTFRAILFREKDAVTAPVSGNEPAESSPQTVTLTEAKRRAVEIIVSPAGMQRLQRIHYVPGRVQYDGTRRVDVKMPAEGVVQDLLVKTGDRVTKAQVLARVSSPDVGAARADVHKWSHECEHAHREYEWKRETSKNVLELIGEIRRRQALDELENRFREKRLGVYRQTLITAYSRLALAESMMAQTQSAADTGALAARTARERKSERESVTATLHAACEQTSFDSVLDADMAEAGFHDARLRLDIARQHLTTLLGYEEPMDLEMKVPEESSSEPDKQDAGLSLVEIRAPFDGIIDRSLMAAVQRVGKGDTMFVLADTSQMWVVGDVREEEWPAIELPPGTELMWESPAIPEQRFTARLHHVGREVLSDTHAIPLVAVVENEADALRPGLFVRVAIPMGVAREVLAVPTAAIAEHEGAEFVFVADGPNEFRRVNVRTGERVGEWCEITQGINLQAPVVVQGTFLLKSELLLERGE